MRGHVASSSLESLRQLLQVLEKGVSLEGALDLANWKLEPKEGYSVKSGNIVLEEMRVIKDIDASLQKAFCSIWITKYLFKVRKNFKQKLEIFMHVLDFSKVRKNTNFQCSQINIF